MPQLYEIHSTKPLEQSARRGGANGHALGYEALAEHAEIAPLGPRRKRAVVRRVREVQGGLAALRRSSGKISFSDEGGRHTYYINTPWPYQAPPGDYLVTVYAVKDGKVVEQAESTVLVEQVGTVKALSSMAKNHGALYGLLSIMVALGAGFGVGPGLPQGRGGALEHVPEPSCRLRRIAFEPGARSRPPAG